LKASIIRKKGYEHEDLTEMVAKLPMLAKPKDFEKVPEAPKHRPDVIEND